MNIKNLSLGFALALLSSCASNSNSVQLELRKHIAANNLAKAKELVLSEKFLTEQNNKLLNLLEKGRVFYLNHDFYQALLTLNEAKELSDQLFTVSISKKAGSLVLNDTADNYYGENYERSLIRFYQSMTHLQLSKVGKYEKYTMLKEGAEKGKLEKLEVAEKVLNDNEKKFHVTAAKSILIEWDSYLNSIKSVTGGEVTFKDDLMAKIYGAFVHENTGISTDLQIAKDLYKASKDLILKNYNIYKSFNDKNANFKKDFSQLSSMPIDKVEQDYVTKTEFQGSLLSYINNRINDLEKGKTHNVLIILEEGLINPKTVKKVDIPLASGGAKDQATAVDGNFISFAAQILSSTDASDIKIYFELPEIQPPLAPTKTKVQIFSMDGKIVQDIDMQLINPMGEIASQALEQQTMALYTKTGLRVAGKHMAALLASYAIYNTNKNKGDLIAMGMASMAYTAANKGIEMSEKADLRSWQTLPQNFKATSTSLSPGEYKIIVENNGAKKEFGNIIVDKNSKNSIITLSI